MPLGPDNPYGVGFSADETEFQTEKQAIRMVNPSTSRIWKIKNPSKLNKMTGEALQSGAALHTLQEGALCRENRC